MMGVSTARHHEENYYTYIHREWRDEHALIPMLEWLRGDSKKKVMRKAKVVNNI